MLVHLQGGKFEEARILQEKTARNMHSQLFTHHPLLDGIAHGFIEGTFNVIFAGIAWWKKYWRIPGRIHYTLFAVATIVLLWFFSYWNVI